MSEKAPWIAPGKTDNEIKNLLLQNIKNIKNIKNMQQEVFASQQSEIMVMVKIVVKCIWGHQKCPGKLKKTLISQSLFPGAEGGI